MSPDIVLAVGGGVTGWLSHAAIVHRRLRAARCDPVTGLPARAAWTRQAIRLLRRGSRVVLLIDLDRFKQVNDVYGHAAGDRVLAVTAARIRAWTDRAGGGACGRIGGDEFVVVTSSRTGGRELAELAAVLAAPVMLPSGGMAPGGASVGASVCAAASALPAALGAADAAMYAAKRGGVGWRLAADIAVLVTGDPVTGQRRAGRRRGRPSSRPRGTARPGRAAGDGTAGGLTRAR